MIKVSVIYPHADGVRFDMDYYATKHMPMVRDRLGVALKGISIDRGLAGGAPVRRRPTSRWATCSSSRWSPSRRPSARMPRP